MAEDELTRLLRARFGAGDFTAPPELEGSGTLTGMAGRASCRAFEAREVPLEIVRALCAVALSAPSKSDLQQRDIVIVDDAGLRASLLSLVADQAWTSAVPRLVVFCGNNRRQRQLHEMWQRPFANDHLDAFFNAAVDAGIALGSFVTAAEAAGLGCCPISTIRNHAAEASELLGLPDHVFPVAALALGYPAAGARRISMRLPLAATVHVDGYRDAEAAAISGYDAARDAAQPATKQRQVEVFGTAERYVWSDDKTRQYSRPERPGFGAFIRGKGFRLD